MERLTKGDLVHCDLGGFADSKDTICGARYCEGDCEDCKMKKIYDKLKEIEDKQEAEL